MHVLLYQMVLRIVTGVRFTGDSDAQNRFSGQTDVIGFLNRFWARSRGTILSILDGFSVNVQSRDEDLPVVESGIDCQYCR